MNNYEILKCVEYITRNILFIYLKKIIFKVIFWVEKKLGLLTCNYFPLTYCVVGVIYKIFRYGWDNWVKLLFILVFKCVQQSHKKSENKAETFD